MDHNPQNISGEVAVAAGLIHSGAYGEAVEWLQELLAEEPNNGLALWELAVAYSELGRDREAITALEYMRQLGYRGSQVLNGIGSLYLKIGEYNRAKISLLRAYAIDRMNPAIMRNLGLVFSALGRHDKAQNLLTAAYQLDPDDYKTVHALAEYFLELGNYQLALPWVRTLLEEDVPAHLREDAESWLARVQLGW